MRALPPAAMAVLAFLALGLLPLAPAVAAQALPQPVLQLTPAKGLDAPLAVDVPTKVSWGWVFSQQTPAQAASAQATTIAWTYSCQDPGVVLSGPATTKVPAPAPGQTQVSGTAEGSLRANATAPGLKVLRCSVTGVTSEAATYPASNKAQLLLAALVDYTGPVQATATEGKATAAPGHPMLLRVTLQSLANAPSTVSFALEGVPEGWTATVPAPVTLAPGASAAVDVVLRGPVRGPYTDTTADVVLKVLPAATVDTAKTGPASTVALQARSWGFDGAWTGGVLALLLVAAVGAVALLRRRGGQGKRPEAGDGESPAPPDGPGGAQP